MHRAASAREAPLRSLLGLVLRVLVALVAAFVFAASSPPAQARGGLAPAESGELKAKADDASLPGER